MHLHIYGRVRGDFWISSEIVRNRQGDLVQCSNQLIDKEDMETAASEELRRRKPEGGTATETAAEQDNNARLKVKEQQVGDSSDHVRHGTDTGR